MRGKTRLNLELSPKINSLPELAEAENACTRCPLYKDATQAVPGEGRRSAHVMLVGEQPGDKEDLSGRPGRTRPRPRAGGGGNSAHGGFRHQCGEAFQARDARQAPAAQASQRLRNRALQDLARSRTRAREAGGHRRARRHGGAQSARPFGHHREAARTGLASCRRHRLRHHPPLVPAAHRGRRRQAARVREFRRRSATGGADIAEKGGLIRPYSSSVNRPLTSASSASTTSAASRPLASTVIVVPRPAASIISPMIEVPPTTSWPRFTFTSASNFSTICTNFAEARACKPFLLQISSTRMMGAASDG